MRIYSATDVGQKRKMNQDYVFASAEPVGNLPNLFVVADGMGVIMQEIMHPPMQLHLWWRRSARMRILIQSR